MKTLSAQFGETIIFGGVVFFSTKFWNFYTKSNIFNILGNIFKFIVIPLTMIFLCLYVL